MSTMTVKASTIQAKDYFFAYPREFKDVIQKICTCVPQLLEKVLQATGEIQMKLLLPVTVHSDGYLWWKKSFVTVSDLRAFGVEESWLKKDHIGGQEVVLVEELRRHQLGICRPFASAFWDMPAKAVKISAAVYKGASEEDRLLRFFVFAIFELINASKSQVFRSLSSKSQVEWIKGTEAVEFEVLQEVKATLKRLCIPDELNHYRLTNEFFQLHLLAQEVGGHVAITEREYTRQFGKSDPIPSFWKHSMSQFGKQQLWHLVSAHNQALYGNHRERIVANRALSRLESGLTENAALNWTWYQDLYEQLSQGEM